ncbi:MurR/RpiR family transcriptional regulator [Azospirillum picis]|uniref:RpiR family carbohydrate utilization transcriptional regulator n=1 Tax=Azospirillum picis TaxID=488438 RepID=A0ABU0MVI0_9PROT|nr:MurR/RpiR family transcriptional regulator [Azospirillum picis]MBP2303353.1 RpiR family carbohydrate utilization transcriptional regulator [Azospirillum picis]MDQ0537194.1 RpiR family carbohydrate utilization transcriptional regulator [Azospirillum picis]
MLDTIASSLDRLRRAEAAVARTVLADPEATVRDSLAQLAARAGVSEPSVLRFCRSSGFDGFQDFKIGLARHLAASAVLEQAAERPAPLVRDLAPGDSVASATEKVLNRAIDALVRLRSRLDATTLERAAAALAHAARVQIVGAGASGAVALDAHHKLFRLLPQVAASSDAHLQAMAAATLGPGDVLLAISKTGTSAEILDAAAIARDGGATVIAITASATPLAERADIRLTVDVDEDTAVHTPMASRLAQLALVDALTVAVGLQAPPGLDRRLSRIKAVLAGHHRAPVRPAAASTLVPEES